MITDNFIRLFENSLKNYWDLKSMTDYVEKRTVTYGEVAQEVAKLHLLFNAMGFEKGDKVALVGKNGINWCVTYMATVTYGGVIVPILQDFNPSDIQHIINHSDAKLLFVSENIWDNINEEELLYVEGVYDLATLKMIGPKGGTRAEKTEKMRGQLWNEKYPNGFTAADVLYPTIPNTELAVISYTSGTTGYSKGVMLSGNALAGNIQYALESGQIVRGGRQLAFLPMAHVFGCTYDFLSAFCGGTHTTYLGKLPSPKILLKAMAEVRPTVIFTVPLVIEKIYTKQIRPMLETRGMKWALSIPLIDNQVLATINRKMTEALGGEFQQIIIGGAAMNPEAEEFFKRIGFKFTVGYGMTECAPLISYTCWSDYKTYSVGRILPNMQVKIDSSDPHNEVGEILVRGEHVMMGYYKNEEATAAAIDKDGWLHTGDMGTVDFDGTIYIKGRNKSMLLGPNGQNIYPEEIEARLNNMPYVLESLVLQMPDNRLKALVVPDLTTTDAAKMSHADVVAAMEVNRKELNKMTASYESISVIELHPTEFQKTPKKSIKRYLYTNLSK
ncbi:MAG: AMP-binding protein [Paludibacteraceae bacterium]|nr:AMP-binding protein [Paludibacteraceae bacterium]